MMGRRSSLIIGGVIIAVSGCTQQDSAYPLPGEIIRQTGSYVSPHSENLVEIQDQEDSEMQLMVAANNDRRVPSTVLSLSSADPWFIAWDDSDNLWIYSNQEGVIKWSRTPDAVNTTNVGQLGGWEGIPESFLDELPEGCKTVYQNWSTARTN